MKKDDSEKCPYCEGQLDEGCVLGNISSLNNFEYGLQWFDGPPSWKKNLLELGEPLGKFETWKGSYILGHRCRACRKIILNY